MELRNVTIPELAAAIAAAPAALREELAKGPAPDWRCRLCRSFRAVGMLNEDDLDGPSKTVWQWHEDHEVLAARAFTETFVEGNPTDEEVDVVTKGPQRARPELGRLRVLWGAELLPALHRVPPRGVEAGAAARRGRDEARGPHGPAPERSGGGVSPRE